MAFFIDSLALLFAAIIGDWDGEGFAAVTSGRSGDVTSCAERSGRSPRSSPALRQLAI